MAVLFYAVGNLTQAQKGFSVTTFYSGKKHSHVHVVIQIVKLNRRLQLLEEENKERSKREVILYSATVAFWLINTWIWFRR